MLDVNWEREPDIGKLRDAHALIRSNPARAIVKLRELVDRGSVMSMVYLADLFERGQGTMRNEVEAEELYRRAYSLGSHLAMFNLGAFYFNRKKYKLAEDLFREGVSRGDVSSMYNLARIYLLDRTAVGNVEKARGLLESAAASGHVFAQKQLAMLLMSRRSGWRNKLRGIRMFFQAPIEGWKVVSRDPNSPLLR